MVDFLISSTTYIVESLAELLLMCSFLGISKRTLFTPFISLIPICSVLNNFIYTYIPNVFGWFLSFPISIICYKILLHVTFDNCIFSYLLTYTLYNLIEALAILAIPHKLMMSENPAGQLTGTSVILLLSIFVSLLPLHKLYKMIQQGNVIIRLILSYISLLLLVTVAVSKIDSIDAIAILPLTVTFMIILLLADIMVMKQQDTITIQQQDIKNYHTYEPMAHNLIADILGKQHDFNNQMNAIRMLPYTYKDYDALCEAIENYSSHLEKEFNESELLKINLPVVAGFVFSKIKEAEQSGKKLSVTVKNKQLHTVVPEYDLIRILGIMIDNAFEATSSGQNIALILDSKDNHILIRTKNEGVEISSELRRKMFVRGYSTKASSETHTRRGQGLPNLKELTDRYNGRLFLDNETFQNKTWICFTAEL